MYPYGWGETSVEGRALAGAYRVGGPEAALELRDSAVPLRVPRYTPEGLRWLYIDRAEVHRRYGALRVQIRASLTSGAFELRGEAEGRHDEVAFLAYLHALEQVGLAFGMHEATLPGDQLEALRHCAEQRPPAPGATIRVVEAWSASGWPKRVPAVSWVGTLPVAPRGRAVVAAHFDRAISAATATAWAAYARRATGLSGWALVAAGPGPSAVDGAAEMARLREYERHALHVGGGDHLIWCRPASRGAFSR